MAKKKKKVAKKAAKKVSTKSASTTKAKKTAKAPTKAKAAKSKATKAKAPAKKAVSKKKATAKATTKKLKSATSKAAASKKTKATKKAEPKRSKATKTPKVGRPKSAAKKTSKKASKVSSPTSKTKAQEKQEKLEAKKSKKPIEPEIIDDATEEVGFEVELGEDEVLPIEGEAAEEFFLTDAEGRRYCRVRDCDQLSSVDGYCRYHYLLFWKRIQVRKKILTEGKLEKYVEDLTARYPDKFLDMLKKDLKNEKDFLAAIQELELDENAEDGDFEEEDQSFIDEVRGMSEAGSTGRGDDDY